MKCSKCQFGNPEGAKFCIECGQPMEFRCPKCGTMTPGKGKFFMECGHSLTSAPEKQAPKDLSFDEKLAKIQGYLPEGLTQKILSQRDRIEGKLGKIQGIAASSQIGEAKDFILKRIEILKQLGAKALYSLRYLFLGEIHLNGQA